MVVLTWATVPLCMGGEGFEGSSFLNAMPWGYLTFCRPIFFILLKMAGVMSLLVAGRVAGESMWMSLILESDLILLTKCYFQLSTGYILCLETR